MTCAIDAIMSYMRLVNGQDAGFQTLHERARNFVVTAVAPHDPKANTEGYYNIDVVFHLLSGLSQRKQKIWSSRGFENAHSTHSIRSDGTDHWVYIDLQTKMIHEGPGRQRPLVAADLAKYYRGICVSPNATHHAAEVAVPRHIDPTDELTTALELSRQEARERREEESLMTVALLISEDLAIEKQIKKDYEFARQMVAA